MDTAQIAHGRAVQAAAPALLPPPRRTPAEPPYRIHRYPSALIDRVRLHGGREVIVRPVLPQDADAEQTFVAALSPRSRRARFHGAVNTLPAAVLQRMTSVDYERHLALVAEARCDDGPTGLVADARYVIDDDRPVEAEFAIAVADDWQGLGLGRAMLERLARHAGSNGVKTLHGSVLADNEPMLGLMRRMGFGFRSDPSDGSILHGRLKL